MILTCPNCASEHFFDEANSDPFETRFRCDSCGSINDLPK